MCLREGRARGRPTRERICLAGVEIGEERGSGGKSGAFEKFDDGGQEEEEKNCDRTGTSFSLKSLRLKTGGEEDKGLRLKNGVKECEFAA